MTSHPRKIFVEILLAAVAQAVDLVLPAHICKENCTVQSVEYVAADVITGANTNTRRIALINKGQSGAGSTIMAEKQFNSGTNAAAFDATVITNSGTAANLDAAAGDVLAVQSEAVGSGLADPGGLLRITLINRDA